MFSLHATTPSNIRFSWAGVAFIAFLTATQCYAKLINPIPDNILRDNTNIDITNVRQIPNRTPRVYHQQIEINSIDDYDLSPEEKRIESLLQESVGLVGRRKQLVEETLNGIRNKVWKHDFINPKRRIRSVDTEIHNRHKFNKRYMTKLKHKHRKHSMKGPHHIENQSHSGENTHYQQKKSKFINRNLERRVEVPPVKIEDNENVEAKLSRWEDIFKNSKRMPRREFKIPEKPLESASSDRKITRDFGLSKVDEMLMRGKRAIVNSDYTGRSHWREPIWLGYSDVKLHLKESSQMLKFRVEAKATGYVALSFGNDAVLTWLDDDGLPHILDCHLQGNNTPVIDEHQDYELAFGLRNATHILVEYQRPLDTCDSDDTTIGVEDILVQWSFGQGDPSTHGGWMGWMGKSFERLLEPWPKPMPPPVPQKRVSADAYEKWNVIIKDVIIPGNMKTTFWVKIFKAPQLDRKHHIVGYTINKDLSARHMVLHECVPPENEVSSWDKWAAGPAFYGPEMPRDWAVCLTPVAAWGSGSKGAMFPQHVGIPFGDSRSPSYYMLEIHYQNASPKKVVESSGMTLLYTNKLRQHDAGIMVTGITVSALHVVSARQHKYTSAGYCAEPCTEKLLPERGIHVVSTLLHAHSASKKISLRHVRNNQELPLIAEEKDFDFRKQEPIILNEERIVKPGDALITECTYDTHKSSKPILGGYSSQQEMCLAFVLHYPRIPLAGCYSMTPVKEFFETFGVKEFYNVDMKQVENMFLASGSLEGFPDLPDLSSSDRYGKDDQGDDQAVSLLSQLVIKEPPEFRNKTFIAHLNEIPWNEPLLTKNIEDTLYKGKHMTFCRQRNDTIAVPIEIRIFPNFTELEDSSKLCQYQSSQNNESASTSWRLQSHTNIYFVLSLIVCSMFFTHI